MLENNIGDNKNKKLSISIIVPTFEEARNLPELLDRIANTAKNSKLFHKLVEAIEIIIVDDNSQDGTETILQAQQIRYPFLTLKFIRRHQNKGLSASVIEGMKQAAYQTYVVMDADLSHPPEKIPELLATLAEPSVDFVIGSRYQSGGSSDKKWSLRRKLISRFAALPARILISSPVQDPLSGFFAVRKSKIFPKLDKLNPIGWKIGLEIMIKIPCTHIREVPIHFSERTQGKSKFNLAIALRYLAHLYHLTSFKVSYYIKLTYLK